MSSQTTRSIQSAFHKSLPVRRLDARQNLLRALRASGAALILTGAFATAVAVGLASLRALVGVLSPG